MGFISPVEAGMKDAKMMIRTAEGYDGKQMHQLTRDVIAEENGLIMTLADFTMTEEDQAVKNDWFIQHPDTLAIVALKNHFVIGILTIEPETFLKTCHRANLGLIVHKNYRSKGVGLALMKAAIQWAQHHERYEKIELEVLQSNKRAINLYNKLGFIEEGTIYKAIKNAPHSYDHLVRMSLFTDELENL
ncbi:MULTISPECIES: GNAT family N-acetyltransferase [Bacillaceae]|uniref:GNAT family N-acetyltransferase n=1 Tax=Evansella alkalicola TaxID=745819 RepID=A0ABS6JTE4_9BACI|nr:MULTISPECIES: GNAT family N-acetyltransferase [Bacillaceae]MBU9721853.1 GNAT family N-acetyltransferase [Bacillus alkalicola]